MQENLLWLSTSLFCCKSHWNYLLREGVKPFLNDTTHEKYLRSYQLEFNYLNGENIRLALLAKEDHAETLAKKTDNYFKNFFSISALPTNEPDLTDWGIFMPFPANSIQYGLYKVDPLNRNDEKDYSFQRELSLLIAEGLGEENIDQETIITFAFYLHVALIKLITAKDPAITTELMQSYHTVPFHETDEHEDIEFMTAKYEDNKEVLQEIAEDIMKHTPSSTTVPSWLERWMELCEAELISDSGQYQEKTLNNIHSRIIYFINKHLSITDKMRLVLYYFITAEVF